MRILFEDNILIMLDKKISLINEYFCISKEMLDVTFEVLAEKIVQRQKIVDEFTLIQEQLTGYIEKQTFSVKDILTRIFRFKYDGFDEIFDDIITKTKDFEKILTAASTFEARLNVQMIRMKSEMFSDMKKVVDSKKVIDFYNAAKITGKSGNKLNELN